MRPRQPRRVHLVYGLTVFMLSFGIASPADSAGFPFHVAVCGDASDTINAVNATEEILTTTRLGLPPGDLVRSTSRLTVPNGERWKVCFDRGSLLLTVTSGAFHVALGDGEARVTRASSSSLGPLSRQKLAAGESIVLGPGDRLIMHGHGSLGAQQIGQDGAVATVIRVS